MTVTRLADERFRVVTGAGAVDSDLGWLRAHVEPGDGAVSLRDASAELAVIGIWGPRARDVVAAVTDDDVSNEALPFGAAITISIGGAAVLAQRITYVGELGYELYVAAGVGGPGVGPAAGGRRRARPRARRLPRARVAADGEGLPLHGHRPDRRRHPVRSRARVLRRAWTRATSSAATRSADARRARAAAAHDPDRRRRVRAVYGGEAVHAAGGVVGRVRSCAYGFTVGRNIAYTYLPAELEPGAEVMVEVFGGLIPAEVADRCCTTRPTRASAGKPRA